jgi:hypothetical protein
MEETEPTDIFGDPESFQKQRAIEGGFNKDMLSFRFVVMNHLMRVIAQGSKEWRGGFWKETQIALPDGRVITTKDWESNTRQVYGNCVRMFYNLIEPKLWKIDPATGVMEEASTFSKDIKECAKKAEEVARRLEVSNDHTPSTPRLIMNCSSGSTGSQSTTRTFHELDARSRMT